MSKSEPMLVRIVYKKTDKSYIKWKRVTTSGTTSDNKWYNEWQGMKTSDSEWQRVVQRMETSGNE